MSRDDNAYLDISNMRKCLRRRKRDVRAGPERMMARWDGLPAGERAPSSRTARSISMTGDGER